MTRPPIPRVQNRPPARCISTPHLVSTFALLNISIRMNNESISTHTRRKSHQHAHRQPPPQPPPPVSLTLRAPHISLSGCLCFPLHAFTHCRFSRIKQLNTYSCAIARRQCPHGPAHVMYTRASVVSGVCVSVRPECPCRAQRRHCMPGRRRAAAATMLHAAASCVFIRQSQLIGCARKTFAKLLPQLARGAGKRVLSGRANRTHIRRASIAVFVGVFSPKLNGQESSSRRPFGRPMHFGLIFMCCAVVYGVHRKPECICGPLALIALLAVRMPARVANV